MSNVHGKSRSSHGGLTSGPIQVADSSPKTASSSGVGVTAIGSGSARSAHWSPIAGFNVGGMLVASDHEVSDVLRSHRLGIGDGRRVEEGDELGE